MKDWSAIKERYLQDELPTRLGGLAANLARIKSFSGNVANIDLVKSLIEESKFFIEWTASNAEIETAAKLVEIQIQLATWQWSWESIWVDENKRAFVAEQSQSWSNSVLEMSGLLSD
ncbi:MAG: hypothetical protein WA999_03435 [Spirulinaceae cyanobacterium]